MLKAELSLIFSIFYFSDVIDTGSFCKKITTSSIDPVGQQNVSLTSLLIAQK